MKEEVLRRMMYIGYDETVCTFVELSEEDGDVVVTRYPRVDDYNGVSESLLRILIRDIDRVVGSLNKQRGNGK